MLEEKRNYGIDLLRILSMLMVMILHILGAGGVLGAAKPLSLNDEGAWLLETAAYCAVNCYGLISGYVGWKSKHHYTSLALLWIQVVLYSAGITLFFAILSPETANGLSILRSFFPVIHNYGWYFTCYFALFFFMPLLNHAVTTMEERDLKILCASVFGVLSVLPTVAMQDIFQIKDGYSVLWLGALYLLGGCVGRFGWFGRIKKRCLALIYAGCVTASWGVKYLFELSGASWISSFTYSEVLIRYKSPTILISALALLLLFAKTDLPKVGRVLISFLSPAAFGVYIIHMHPEIWNRIIVGKFAGYADKNLALMLLYVLGTATVLYLVFSLADLVRHALFRGLKLKQRLRRWESHIRDGKKETI
ncbi:MAG: acyltransferase [Clostridia bacterium]|nr:acyltransferase [Clostridia bacterium]